VKRNRGHEDAEVFPGDVVVTTGRHEERIGDVAVVYSSLGRLPTRAKIEALPAYFR